MCGSKSIDPHIVAHYVSLVLRFRNLSPSLHQHPLHLPAPITGRVMVRVGVRVS